MNEPRLGISLVGALSYTTKVVGWTPTIFESQFQNVFISIDTKTNLKYSFSKKHFDNKISNIIFILHEYLFVISRKLAK